MCMHLKWLTHAVPIYTMLEGLWLCNRAVSEKIPQKFTSLLYVRYVVSFIEGINLLQAWTNKQTDRQTQLLHARCACTLRVIIHMYIYMYMP